MEDVNTCSNNGILTRSQMKMLLEKSAEKSSTTTTNEPKKIKITEKNKSQIVIKKEEDKKEEKKQLITSLESSVSDLEIDFITEEEGTSEFYTSEDEEDLKKFEDELMNVMKQADKEEAEER